MADSEGMKVAIQSVIKEMMDKVMENVLLRTPFIPEEHRASKPLYAALVPDEIFKGSHFERRFVTPFGKVEKILKLHCMEPTKVDGSYFALPYNPYGLKENYSWSFPSRWFNMKEDEVVLIGNEFWEKVGGLGTYQAFISAVDEIGQEYKNRIYREFLGIEPPDNALIFTLGSDYS